MKNSWRTRLTHGNIWKTDSSGNAAVSQGPADATPPNPDFWTIFEKAKETGVFYFWGHSYEMMDEKKLWQETEEKLKRLDADPDVVWVDVIDLVK